MLELDNSRRKAFRQLERAGFRVERCSGKDEVKIVTPDGVQIGRFSLPHKNRQTPHRLTARIRQWERGIRAS